MQEKKEKKRRSLFPVAKPAAPGTLSMSTPNLSAHALLMEEAKDDSQRKNSIDHACEPQTEAKAIKEEASQVSTFIFSLHK